MGRLDCLLFFFFKAEDGIRDFHVTGVQTCALPISRPTREDGKAVHRAKGHRCRQVDGNGEVREMRHAKAVLEIAYGTGEPSAVNAARSVREGVDGKGPGNRNLAGGLLHGHVRFGGGPSEKGLVTGTSPAAYRCDAPVMSSRRADGGRCVKVAGWPNRFCVPTGC